MNTTDKDTLLGLAEALEKYGIYRSALKLFTASPDLYGQRANSLRKRLNRNAAAGRLQPGIYALAVLQRFSFPCGCVVPLSAERGDCKALAESCGGAESKITVAFRLAFDLAKRAISWGGTLPDLYIVVPERLPLFGESVGLPAALAFVEKWSGRTPHVPALATGAVDAAGNLLPVEGLPEKIDAALVELAESPGLVLIPGAQFAEALKRPTDRLRPVWTLEEAVRTVWSEYPVAVDRSLVSLEATLRQAEDTRDPAQALRILLSHPTEGLARADRARLLFAIGSQYRHLGRSEDAARVHGEARTLLAGREGTVGRQGAERLEMEAFATDLDLFALEGLEAELRARLEQPFLADHNKVRCQGILAQLLSTMGLHAEAVRLRQCNLSIQTGSEAMRREIPRTLACLAYESARGGMADVFEKAVRDLFDMTDPADTRQVGYNLCAVGRGLVLLGRHMDLLDWGRGRALLWGKKPSPALVRLVSGETSEIQATYPEVSLVRVLVRALRRAGEPDRAVVLGNSLEVPVPTRCDLVLWLAALVEVEVALALSDAGHKSEGLAVLSSAAEKLKTSHPWATRFYAVLVSEAENSTLADVGKKKIEVELDRVYY